MTKNTDPNKRPKPDKEEKKKQDEMTEKEIDETIEDTFPASDPPSWSPGTTG